MSPTGPVAPTTTQVGAVTGVGGAIGRTARMSTGSQGAGPAPGSGPIGIPNATRLSPAEQATAARLQAQTGLRLRESPHRGAEYIDDLGRTYDALGDPRASQFWDERRFLTSIDHHLLKSNDFTVIDLTGFTPAQIAVVRSYVDGLPQASQAKIIRIGF